MLGNNDLRNDAYNSLGVEFSVGENDVKKEKKTLI